MSRRSARAAYPPSHLYLTAFHDADYPSGAYPGAAWPGAVSAGPSASWALYPDGVSGVDPGISLNGHVPAHLVSTPSASGYFSSGTTPSNGLLSDFASRAAFCGWFIVDPTPAVYTFNFGLITRDEHQGFTLGYIKSGAQGETQNVLRLVGVGDTNFAVARKVITIDSGHVPHIVTFRITGGGRCQVGINEPPGAAGGAADQPFIDPFFAVAAIGGPTPSKLNIGYFGGNGITGYLYQYGLTNRALTDNDFADVILHARVKFAQAFLP